MGDEANKKLQLLALEVRLLVDQMADIAHSNGIASIPFLHGALQFGVQFDGPGRYSKEGTARRLGGYQAAKYPMMIEDGYEWRASQFECFPSDREREWLFGEERANWPKTDYEDDD